MRLAAPEHAEPVNAPEPRRDARAGARTRGLRVNLASARTSAGRATGVLLTAAVAAAALGLAHVVPLGSAPVLGILLGVCVGAALTLSRPARKAVK
jgi:hypothetical protein